MTQINAVVNPAIPDAYITIVPPSIAVVEGVPTDQIAVVGTATWGPVNAPTPVSPSNVALTFGYLQPRLYDLGTVVAAAALAGGNNFRIVRVTDGTDAAASVVIGSTGVTITSKYTGTGANADTVTLAAGTAPNSTKVTVARPNRAPEVFDNITGTSNALWVAIAGAINNGQSGLRGPSNLVVAAAGSSTSAPTNGTYSLTGGADGVASITSAVLVGADTGTRSGMYALRGIGPAMLVLADCSDYTTIPTQESLALSEGFYAICVGPSGEYTTLSTVAANLATAGVDTYAVKVLVGDWCYFLDTVNGGTLRLISPQGFMAGQLASLLPFESSLNKPIVGVVGTQKSNAKQVYSEADLQVIGQGRLDVIANPCPGGAYYGGRFGKNASSNAAVNGDNYSRMVPYLAFSLAGTVGQFVGEVQTADQRADAIAAVDNFLYGLANATPVPWISNPDGTQPYSIVCDDTNNPPASAAAGKEVMDVRVQLGPIIFQFLLNLQAGQTVTVATQPTL